MSIFTSADAKATLERWHVRFRQKIGVPTESVSFSTRLGNTHTLICGARDAPALVCLHGAMASSAHVLVGASALARGFRLIAPDIPGQSPMSAEIRPDIDGSGYSDWLADVFDALDLDQANLFGASWGGLIALRAAARMPQRIRKLSLIVPAGIVQGPVISALVRIGWPMMRYRSSPTADRRTRFLKYLITTRDDDWETYLGDAALGFKHDFKPIRLLKRAELSGLSAPVQVIAAELDFQSPGGKLVARAQALIPNLKDAALIPRSHHVPPFTEEFQNWLSDRMSKFLLDLPNLTRVPPC
jgi:2-hydroxy-6-oxonona-2,4-dienedioate hydrolase